MLVKSIRAPECPEAPGTQEKKKCPETSRGHRPQPRKEQACGPHAQKNQGTPELPLSVRANTVVTSHVWLWPPEMWFMLLRN